MTIETVPWWNIQLDSVTEDMVISALRGRTISQGRITEAFENALAEKLCAHYAVCTVSGSMALTMALIATGIGPGDEVIIPNRTWVATASSVLLLGAKVKLVDSKAGTCIVDPKLVEAAITPRTKAIIPVPLNGKAVDIDYLIEMASKRGINVIEDACQAMFSRLPDGRYMGTSARFGCFSLGMAKSLTTGAGGVVICRDENDARLLRRIRNQGLSNYDLSELHNVRASNFKFTDIQAAIGMSQISRIADRIRHQQKIQELYSDGLAGIDGIKLQSVNIEAGEVPMRTEILVKSPIEVKKQLLKESIDSCLQAPNLAEFPFVGANPADYPNSYIYAHHMLVLPSGPDQPLQNIQHTIEVLHRIVPNIEPW